MRTTTTANQRTPAAIRNRAMRSAAALRENRTIPDQTPEEWALVLDALRADVRHFVAHARRMARLSRLARRVNSPASAGRYAAMSRRSIGAARAAKRALERVGAL
jgi:hypothetical protein